VEPLSPAFAKKVGENPDRTSIADCEQDQILKDYRPNQICMPEQVVMDAARRGWKLSDDHFDAGFPCMFHRRNHVRVSGNQYDSIYGSAICEFGYIKAYPHIDALLFNTG
jgi:hypothetical protein